MTRKDIHKLDKYWADTVKSVAEWCCAYCHAPAESKRLEAAHVVGRRHRFTRWGCEVDGKYDLCGHALCHSCHQQYDEHGPQEQWIILNVIGTERKENLQFLATTNIARYQDYDEIRKRIQEVRDEFEAQSVGEVKQKP